MYLTPDEVSGSTGQYLYISSLDPRATKKTGRDLQHREELALLAMGFGHARKRSEEYPLAAAYMQKVDLVQALTPSGVYSALDSPGRRRCVILSGHVRKTRRSRLLAETGPNT